MASRVDLKSVGAVGSREVNLSCKFTTTTSGAFTTSTKKGVTSITRNSAGKYTFVFTDKWVDYKAVVFTLQGVGASPGAGKAVTCEVLSYTTSTKTMVVQLLSTVTAADVEDGATCRFHFVMDNGVV